MSESTLRTGLSPTQWCKTHGLGNPETVRQLLKVYEEVRGTSLQVGGSTTRLISPEVSGLLVRAFGEAQASSRAVEPVFRNLLAVTQEPKDELAVAARSSVALFEEKLLEFSADLAERLTQATDQRFELAETEWHQRTERRMMAIDQFQGRLLVETQDRFTAQLAALIEEQERDLESLRHQRQQDLLHLSQAAKQLDDIRQTSRQTQVTVATFQETLGELERRGAHLDQVLQASQSDRLLSQQLLRQSEAFHQQVQTQRLRLPAWVGFGATLGFTLCLLVLLLAPGLLNSRPERLIGLGVVWGLTVLAWACMNFRS